MKTITAGLYEHYKGPQYQVMEVAQHSETLRIFGGLQSALR